MPDLIRCSRCGSVQPGNRGPCAGCLLRGILESTDSSSEEMPEGEDTAASASGGNTLPQDLSLEHFSAPTFAAAGPGVPAGTPDAATGKPVFPGFDLLDELGRGGMGIVYRAFDRKRNRVVALKTLQRMNPALLYRFKREFRVLANVVHPNLVPLYELTSDGKDWCFTMEYVEGQDLLRFIRGGKGPSRPGQPAPALTTPAQWQRLRSSLVQVAEGLLALHSAGKLHRDIKPSNILVAQQSQVSDSPEARVVILDFGLAAELGQEEVYQSTEQHVLGTVAYMSPEQAAAQPVSPATDWYSLGVILYEAMTGYLPFVGNTLHVLREKCEGDPPPPRAIADTVPEDLNALCVALLSRDPTARPSGREVIRRLASRAPEQPEERLWASRSDPGPRRPPAILGRTSHLQQLDDAFQSLQEGRTVLVQISGQSGMGKSTLLQGFLERIKDQERAVVLAGQCYEKESVPYKAFDSLVDALGRYLSRLPPLQLEAILPRDVEPLGRVFPVLRDLPATFRSRPAQEAPDPQELRRRAFGALRELLGRLGDRQPLVLAIDDLQWGDLDSLALYGELLRPPDPPRLLFLGSFRSEEVESSPFLQALLAPQALSGTVLDQRRLAVGPLTPAEARELARGLLGPKEPAQAALAETIAGEAGGNPFFILELVEYVRQGGIWRAQQVQEQTFQEALSLAQVLWTRIRRLPEESQRLLEILAVAGQPVALNTALQAAGLGAAGEQALAKLRASRLVRASGRAAGEEITTYHDRVRETVATRLTPDQLRACHRRLALALEASGTADPEALAIHFQGAQELDRAGSYLVRAADKAVDALAFDRASRFYQSALDLQPAEGPQRPVLQRKLADSLARARRGAEAAPVYLEAARQAAATEALELRRRAVEQLLWSGRIDEGMDLIHDLLASMGMRLPRTPFQALLSILYHRFWIWLRGFQFRARPASDLAPELLVRIDTCESIGVGLCCVDPFKGLEFQTRYLLLALRAGEPSRVLRALAMEIGHSSCGGGRSRRRTERIYQIALALAQQLQQPYGLAIARLGGGLAAYFEGRWKQARLLCDEARDLLRQHCCGVTWELNEAHFNGIRALEFLGDLKELSHRLPALLQDAEVRGDRYAATNLRTRLSYLVSLMHDDPDQAQQDMRQAMQQWSQRDFHLQHYFELTTQTDICHYRGDPAGAWQKMLEHWPAVVRSLLLYIQISRITLHQLRARSALALAATPGAASRREDLLREAQRGAAAVERERMPWSNPQALLLRAGIAAVRGQPAECLAILQQAESGFESADMHLYAAVARRRRGQVLGGESGRRLVQEAEVWMATQDIRNPTRWTAMYAPGFADQGASRADASG